MKARWPVLGWLAVAVWVAAWLSAMLPLAIVEGDDAGLALAALERNLAVSPALRFGYRPEFQPGWVALTAWFVRLTGSDALLLQASLAAGCALLNLGLLTEWTHRAAGLTRWGAALVVLAQQEVGAQLYYANSTAPALSALLVGLLIARRARARAGWVAAGSCFGLAVWLRLDAAVAAPAVILWVALRSPRELLPARMGGLAAGAILSFGGLALLSGWEPGSVWQIWQQHQSIRFAWWQRWQAFLAFASLASGLAVLVGGWMEARAGSRQLWLPGVCGAVTLGLALGGQLSTPKYLLWLLPWWCGLAALGVQAAGRASRPLAAALLALFALQYLAPWGSLRWVLGPAAAWLGPGLPPPGDHLLHTDDGPRLLDGIAFAPLHWSVEKRASQAAAAGLRGALREGSIQVVAASTWVGRMASALALLEEGYVCQERRAPPRGLGTEAFRWRRDRDARTVWLLAMPEATRDAGHAVRAALQAPGVRGVWVFSRDVGGVAVFHGAQFDTQGLDVRGPAHECPASLLEVWEIRLRPGGGEAR